MNPLHKADEQDLLDLFRRVWVGAGEIASAEIRDAPDVRGVLTSGRRFGMEIVTLTESARAQSDDALHGSFTRELEAACATAGVHASFSLGLGDWQAHGLTDRTHRDRVVALLVQLATEAGSQPLDLNDDALGARGIADLDSVSVKPIAEGIEVYFGLSSWIPGSDFVRERIAQKDERAPKYRAAIGDADLWLLLLTGTTLAASVIRPSPTETFETRFDRVFLMECWRDMEKVVELAVKRIE